MSLETIQSITFMSSIVLNCNDQLSYVVPSAWIDRWELLSGIRDEMGIDSKIEVPYKRAELEPWIKLNVAMSLIGEMEGAIQEKRWTNFNQIGDLTEIAQLDDRMTVDMEPDHVMFPWKFEQPSLELYRFFLPSIPSLLMKIDRKEGVEKRMKEYESLGKEIRTRGVRWFYALHLGEEQTFHQNLCVSSDVMIDVKSRRDYHPDATEKLLDMKCLNLFMGIAHNAYLSTPFKFKKTLIWDCIDWEALCTGCREYGCTPHEDASRVYQTKVFTGCDQRLIGLYTVLSGQKYQGILPYHPAYNSASLRREHKSLTLINTIYSGYKFASIYVGAADYYIEMLGLNAILKKDSTILDKNISTTFGWMNHIVLKRLGSEDVVEQVKALGEHFGTAAITCFKQLFEHHVTSVDEEKERRKQFITAASAYIAANPNKLPTKIPVWSNDDE